MEDQTSSTGPSAEVSQQSTGSTVTQQEAAAAQNSAPAAPAVEHRQAYGTARTENLRDSGIWRVLLPGFIVLACLALLAIPLIILVWLLVNALLPQSPTASLLWVWIVMIIVILAIVAVIIRGLVKVFMTQPINY
jgi:ABC-type bacteriocin/lantibiotic exporter with double-glycine peptidase domain